MSFSITILGSASAKPTVGRHPSSQIVNLCEQYYLVDAGEGCQRQMLQYGVNPLKIRAIFISHLHGDHLYGLFPLLSTLGLYGRKTSLVIYAPRPFGELLESHMRLTGNTLSYRVEWREVDTRRHSLLFENRTLEVWSIPLDHRIATSGYLFREKSGGESGRSYGYLSDTRFSQRAAELCRGVDTLYHEATYMHKDQLIASQRGHSTATEAAQAATIAGASRLLLGHFSARYKDLTPVLEQARELFPESYLAEEGLRFEIERREDNI